MNLAGHLALGRRPGFQRTLDERTRLLVSQLAAERSGCRWCIEQGRHAWRVANLPMNLLRHLARPPLDSATLSDRDQAALAFAEAVVSGLCPDEIPQPVYQRTRQVFSDGEIAELVLCIAEHHFLDCTEF